MTEKLEHHRERIGGIVWSGVDFEARRFNRFKGSGGSLDSKLGRAFLLRQVSEVNRRHLGLVLVRWGVFVYVLRTATLASLCVLPNPYTKSEGELGITQPTDVHAMDFSNTSLRNIAHLCSLLSTAERKSLITLARSQSIPGETESPILFQKVSPILNRLCVHPPFVNLSTNTLTLDGDDVIRMVLSPLLAGLLIVFSLGMPFSDSEITAGKSSSFNKELCATQTRRKAGEWNWRSILGCQHTKGDNIHYMFPKLSPLQRRFQYSLSRFRKQINGRTILPHYSRRGVSSESASLLINRVDKRARYGVNGPMKTFHRSMEPSNITSLDLIHHYIRTGNWIHGRTEMKQRWYPNGIQPRTYFSWGGDSIASSAYLRDFFNDLADCFPSTERSNRVRPDWLFDDSIPPGGFFFYDLTSFTSWFHEQVPFLEALAEYFADSHVFLVGEGLSLSYHSIGSLIDGYIRWCNDFPEYIISKDLSGSSYGDIPVVYKHLCAGFLGIPGNLVMCTLPHGLAMASCFDNERQLQVPGDDVGASYWSDLDMKDKMTCASTLGSLQMEKVYHLPEISVYLKRLVVDRGNSISLADMLIFPLLPFLTDNTRDSQISMYRPPRQDLIVKRACSVMVTFQRDLWKLTKGDIKQYEADLILSFLQGIHDRLRIPYGAVWQSRFFCDEGPVRSEALSGVTMKFPVDDPAYIFNDPDLRFADRFVEVMHIRSTIDVEITTTIEELSEGQILYVPKRRGWTFLEDMGYVDIRGIPGEILTLVGPDAKTAFLNAQEPNLREVRVLCDIGVESLRAVGIISSNDDPGILASPSEILGDVYRDVRTEQSWRYSRYVDLDAVVRGGVSYSIRSRDLYVNDRGWRGESPLSDTAELDY